MRKSAFNRTLVGLLLMLAGHFAAADDAAIDDRAALADLKTGKGVFLVDIGKAGKLNFYLTALDEEIKAPEDNPSIGLVLCKERNSVVAEYALRDLNKPMGVSRYDVAQAVPEELKASLPTVEELEQELAKD